MTYYGLNPEENLEILASNPYPGRLLLVGYSGASAVLGYALEGRSEGSRNRRLIEDGGEVSTEILDPSQDVGDPSLTIYDAMRSFYGAHVVSNGNQTDTVIRYGRSGRLFREAMEATTYEPDEPNFTPRITGVVDTRRIPNQPSLAISVISRYADTGNPVRQLFTDNAYDAGHTIRGDNIGHVVHTYAESSPEGLKPFTQRPFPVPISDKAVEVAAMIWENLDKENRVAVAARTITATGVVDTQIINKRII